MTYQGAETLCIHMIWTWDGLQVCLEPQPLHYNITQTQTWPYPNLPRIHCQLAKSYRCKGAPICPSAAYQGSKSIFIHMTWMWDGLQVGLEPQTWHYNMIWAQPCPNFPKILPHLHRHHSVRVHPYAHPWLTKVLKHFVYIWYGCGMDSKWDDITTILGLIPIPQIHLHLHRHISVRAHPFAHPWHIKVLNCLVYIWYESWMPYRWAWSLNHDITA